MSIVPPSNIINAMNEYVSYQAYDAVHGVQQIHTNEACYSAIRSEFSRYEITLIPKKSNPAIDEDLYFRWMNICRLYKILPEGCLFYKENKELKMKIPAKTYTRHEIYSALCCYRWISCNQRMIWHILQLQDTLKDVTFWQILHYCFSKYIDNVNHSFVNIGKCSYLDNKNLALTIACKEYFKDRNKLIRYDDSYLNNSISSFSLSFGCFRVKKGDIITNKYTKMYEIDATKEELTELFNKIESEHGNDC